MNIQYLSQYLVQISGLTSTENITFLINIKNMPCFLLKRLTEGAFVDWSVRNTAKIIPTKLASIL